GLIFLFYLIKFIFFNFYLICASLFKKYKGQYICPLYLFSHIRIRYAFFAGFHMPGKTLLHLISRLYSKIVRAMRFGKIENNVDGFSGGHFLYNRRIAIGIINNFYHLFCGAFIGNR